MRERLRFRPPNSLKNLGIQFETHLKGGVDYLGSQLEKHGKSIARVGLATGILFMSSGEPQRVFSQTPPPSEKPTASQSGPIYQGPELVLPQLASTPVPAGETPPTTPETPQVVAPSDVAPQQLTPLEPQAQTPETPTVDTEPQAFREGATGETRPSVEPVAIPEVRMISEEKIGGSSYLRTFTTEKLGASIRVGVSGPEGHLGNLADFVGGKLDIIFAPSTDTNIRYDEPIIQGGRIVYREKIVRAGDLDLVYDGANYLLDAWKYRGWKRIHLPDGRIVIVFALTDYGLNNLGGAAIGLAQSLQNVALIGSWYDRYSPNDRRGVDPSLNPEPRQNHGAPFLRLVYSP